MGKPAARMGDLTAHGGTVALGLPTVLIGKMPASALGDMHICPMVTVLVPHVGGPITLGSMGVLIGKKPAARVSDLTTCVGPPSMPAMGCFTVLIGEAGSGSQAASAGAASAAQAASKTGPKAVNPFPLAEPPGPVAASHFIQCEFTDSAGQPLAGVPYCLTDPDKQEIAGASSCDGAADHGGYAKAGSFEVFVPELKNAKWKKSEIKLGEAAEFSVEADLPKTITEIFVNIFQNRGAERTCLASMKLPLQGKKAQGSWNPDANDLAVHAADGTLDDPPESADYDFVCESLGIVAVSDKLRIEDDSEPFREVILYSPSRKEYLVLETEDEFKPWYDEIQQVEKLKGKSRQAWENSDPSKRHAQLTEVSKQAEKLFGNTTAHVKKGLEELLVIKSNRRWGKTPSWVYIRPYGKGDGAEVKGHWRKHSDGTVQKNLDKLLKQGKSAKGKAPMLEGKLKASFFKQDPVAGQAWKWREEADAGGENQAFHFSADAAVLRYMLGWDGLEASWDPKKKKVQLSSAGQASLSLFEGKIGLTWDWPDQDGVNLLEYLGKVKGMNLLIEKNRECRLKIRLDASSTAFAGLSARAALAFPVLDYSKDLKAETSAEAGGLAGAQAQAELKADARWAPSSRADFASLGSIGGKVGGTAGLAAEAKLKVEMDNGKFRFHVAAGLAIGLGGKTGFSFEVSLVEGWKLIGHLFDCVDSHLVVEITQQAFDTYKNLAFAVMTEGVEVLEQEAQMAADAVADFGGWLGGGAGQNFKKVKYSISVASANKKELAYAPPEALGQALITVMQTRESSDFQIILDILHSTENDHKLKWILRYTSGVDFPPRTSPNYNLLKGNNLKLGIAKIRAFGNGRNSQEKNDRFLNDFNNLLNSKGITL